MFGRENGRLELRGDELIQDGTDASLSFECVITGDTYLYANPDQVSPVHDKVARRHFPADAAAASSAPDPIKHNDKLFLVLKRLKKNEKVFARRMKDYPGVCEVLTFKQQVQSIKGMQETGLGIESGMRGYVDARKINADPDARESFKPLPDGSSLFPNPDLMQDIAQYKLGDCFFLASIQAILSLLNGSDLIRGMMVRDGNDTIVRLFHPDTHEPVYIRVNNTVYHRAGSRSSTPTLFSALSSASVDDKMISHHAPWVHILEKAYVAMALQKATDKDLVVREHTVTTPSFRQMYGNGGDVVTAIRILTGMEAEDVTIKSDNKWYFDGAMLSYCYWKADRYVALLASCPDILIALDKELSNITKDELDHILSYFTLNCESLSENEDVQIVIGDCCLSDNIKAALLEKIRSGVISVDLLRDYLTDAFNKKTEGDTLIKTTGGFSGYLRVGQTINLDKLAEFQSNEKQGADGLPTINDMNERIEGITKLMRGDVTAAEKQDAINIMQTTLYSSETDAQASAKYDGLVGTGIYSDSSRLVFENIKQNLDLKRIIAISTHSDKGKIHVPGVYSRHAYTVIDAFKKGDLNYVRLRNPWGHTGHTAKWNRNLAEYVSEESPNGEFDIELSLFMRCVNKYTIGGSAGLRAIDEAQIHDVREQLERDQGVLQLKLLQLADREQRLIEQREAQDETARQQAETARQQAAQAERLAERERAIAAAQVLLHADRGEEIRLPIRNRRTENVKSVSSYKYEIFAATAVSTLAFAGAGFALGWFFAPVTFGLSVPAMAGIAAGIGAAVGFAVGLTTSVIASRIAASRANAKQRKLDARDGATDSLLGRQDSTQRLHATIPVGNRPLSAAPAVCDDKVLHLGGGMTMFDVTEEQKDAEPAAKAADSSRLSPPRR